jgi:hypothetical protein
VVELGYSEGEGDLRRPASDGHGEGRPRASGGRRGRNHARSTCGTPVLATCSVRRGIVDGTLVSSRGASGSFGCRRGHRLPSRGKHRVGAPRATGLGRMNLPDRSLWRRGTRAKWTLGSALSCWPCSEQEDAAALLRRLSTGARRMPRAKPGPLADSLPTKATPRASAPTAPSSATARPARPSAPCSGTRRPTSVCSDARRRSTPGAAPKRVQTAEPTRPARKAAPRSRPIAARGPRARATRAAADAPRTIAFDPLVPRRHPCARCF